MIDGVVGRIKRYFDEVDFDFVGWRRPAMLVSGLLVLASLLSLVWPGPNWGIDFTGGTEVQLQFEQPLEIGELRTALESIGVPGEAVQAVGGDAANAFKVRIQDTSFGVADLQKQVVDGLVKVFGADWLEAPPTFSAEVGARFSIRYTGERVLPDRVAAALVQIDGVSVAEGREDNELVVKVPGLAAQIEDEIKGAMGGRSFTVLNVESVGPKVGGSLRTNGFLSLIISMGLIMVYTAFRFEAAYAPGAVVALFHDAALTCGFMVLSGREFSLETIGALLTIIGYSMNDTVVIYDRVREVRGKYRREEVDKAINKALNETLSRTVVTAGATMLAITPFLFMGTEVIRTFNMALFFGIIVGGYSSLFVATPLILEMERLLPYVQRFFALAPASDGPVSDEDDVAEGFLTESEKRRRERDKAAREADPEGQA